MVARLPQQFFDSRSKYFNFVHSTDEKSRIAFYLARRFRARHTAEPFYLLDAGTGEGTIIATFLSAVHAAMKNTPIIATGKEISADDVQILLSYLADRFAEHRALVFNLTNLSYQDLAAINAGKRVAFDYHPVALRGSTSYEFALQLTGLADFVNHQWALDMTTGGRLQPKRKTLVTFYRQDHATLLKPFLPATDAPRPPKGYDYIIASQPFRLRQPLPRTCQRVLLPLLNLLQPNGDCFLFYSSGADFSKKLLAHWYPHIDAFANTQPAQLLAALADASTDAPGFIAADITHRISKMRFGFKNFNLEQKEFSLTNVLSLWNAVTYVGQMSDDELQTLTIDDAFMDTLAQQLRAIKRLTFQNHVIHFHKN